MQIKTRRTYRALSGSAIVEALMSVSIIGITGGGLISSFGYGFMAMQMVRENQRATQIILEKVETVRLYSWDQLMTPNFVPPTFSEAFDPQAAPGGQGTTFNGSLTIVDADPNTSYSSNLREVQITVTWTSINKTTRSRTLSTLVAKDGLQNYVY